MPKPSPFHFDENEADRPCQFFEKFLRFSKGKWAGQPLRLLPWQREMLRNVFGWRRKDGTRQYRTVYVEIAKKNGKSSFCSGLALYLAIADREPGAEVYCAASDRQQAGIVYTEAKRMVKASPDLSAVCRVKDSRKSIECPNNSIIRVISSEAYTAEGLNIHGLIFDELHAQKTRELWDALRYGGAARSQPLLISITTAGWDTTSICYEQHEYAKGVLSGEIKDPTFYPMIYAADPDDPIDDPKTWAKANPSLGTTISKEDFAADAAEALVSTTKLNAFKRYRLNIWTSQMESWLNEEQWDKCCDESAIKDPVKWRQNAIEALKGSDCYAGLDLGSVSDLTALCIFFPDMNVVLPWFWVPESALRDNRNQNRDLYMSWQRDGFIIVTPGDIADYAKIRQDLAEICGKFNVIDLAVDRLFQGAQLCTELMDDGHNVIGFGQGYFSMASPTRELEERVISGNLDHGFNPVLRWMSRNVTVKTDEAGNMKPAKPNKKNKSKIDGIVALIMALGRVNAEPDEPMNQVGFVV